MDFAVLENSKVKFVIGIFPSNWQQFEEVVVCNDNVREGDDCILGNFYRDGELVKSSEVLYYEKDLDDMLQALIDEAEEIDQLEEDNDEMLQQLIDN